ncbi:hypothetical protein TNCV_741221 [Trichonephila clavipes]|nr:hypothetical protein TNCV_741221 [Trichonephila clavipes]
MVGPRVIDTPDTAVATPLVGAVTESMKRKFHMQINVDKLRVLVAALWDKKLAFRTLLTASVEGKAIFGSLAASKFSFGEKERPAQRSKLIYSVNGESVEGKRFSEAVLQVNSASEKRASCSKIKLIYSVNGESVEGKRFSEAVLQVNSASEKKSVLLKDQTDL